MLLTYFGRYIIKDRRYIEKEYRISDKNKNTVDYYNAWIKDNKGNIISVDIEKIPKEYIIDGLRNIWNNSSYRHASEDLMHMHIPSL